MKNPSLVFITGPTGTGKSALAAGVARTLGGVVVNADSLQVYRGLEILTACPSSQERRQVPHRLYAFRSPDHPFSVAEWLTSAQREVQRAAETDQTVVFVGGTGLYFRALERGLAPVPAIPAELRRTLRRRIDEEGVKALYADLKKNDPVMARALQPNDRQRILRALEVVLATGVSLHQWQKQTGKGLPSETTRLKICLTMPRPKLEARLRARLLDMIAKGVLSEIETLRQSGLQGDVPVLKALGLRPFLRHLQGELSLEEALALAVVESRRYAKRQVTWFRNQFSDWIHLAAEPNPLPAVVSLVEKTFRKTSKHLIKSGR